MTTIPMECPCCHKRAFDTDAFPKENVTIYMVCPNCKQKVPIPLVESNIKRNRPNECRRAI